MTYNAITAVTTYNRLKYLKEFVSSWNTTKSSSINWTLVVADDGSSDKTLDWLTSLSKEKKDYKLVVIKNNRMGVHYQTNDIFDFSKSTSFDYGFKCDDDILFLKKGWDVNYISAINKTKFDHLVYYNREWKKEQFVKNKGLLTSYCSAAKCLGCFWTYTPRLLDEIGYFDYKSFGFRGNGHIDFTIRACRSGFNVRDSLYDIKNSNLFIGMQPRKGYIQTISSSEMKKYSNKEEQKRRSGIINTEGRVFIPRQ